MQLESETGAFQLWPGKGIRGGIARLNGIGLNYKIEGIRKSQLKVEGKEEQ